MILLKNKNPSAVENALGANIVFAVPPVSKPKLPLSVSNNTSRCNGRTRRLLLVIFRSALKSPFAKAHYTAFHHRGSL
jgi:hypothetical protein